MFGTIGFAVDIGLGQFKKHAEQAAADSAALAAASYAAANSSSCSSGITCNAVTNCTIPQSVSTPFGAGCVYAKANGYTQGGSGGQTVTMMANNTNSPVSGNSTGLWFQATVGESYAPAFGSFGGITALNIHASAVAGVNTTGGASCIVALSQSGTAFTVTGSGNITTSSCGIYDNSNLSYVGSGNITAGTTQNPATIQYIGTKTMTGSGKVTPTPTATTTAAADPFAGVPAPPVGSCTNPNPGLSYPLVISDASNHTISPGTYCGGMKLSGSGTLTFSSGTYIINGTDSNNKSLDFSGSGNLSGANVMFFITGQNGYIAGPVDLEGSGNFTFSALSSGNYEGILIYQDRSVTYAASNKYTGSGNVTGTFYFPTTTLTYSGSGNAKSQALVANKITMSGSGNFVKDTTGTLTGLVKTTASLIQ